MKIVLGVLKKYCRNLLGPYIRTFFPEVFTDSVTCWLFFHATSTVFSVRINIFTEPLQIFFCRANVKSKQIWRKSTNQDVVLQNQNKLPSPTTKNQNKYDHSSCKNLLIPTEKTVEIVWKKQSMVTESVQTSRTKHTCIWPFNCNTACSKKRTTGCYEFFPNEFIANELFSDTFSWKHFFPKSGQARMMSRAG